MASDIIDEKRNRSFPDPMLQAGRNANDSIFRMSDLSNSIRRLECGAPDVLGFVSIPSKLIDPCYRIVFRMLAVPRQVAVALIINFWESAVTQAGLADSRRDLH
jgi:hypothetical protein